MHQHTTPEAAEIRANVRSIEAIPAAILPHGPARSHLLELARSGADCYAYRAVGHGPWNVWMNGQRVPVREYAAGYAGISQEGGRS